MTRQDAKRLMLKNNPELDRELCLIHVQIKAAAERGRDRINLNIKNKTHISTIKECLESDGFTVMIHENGAALFIKWN
jgi:hypothetical protein